MKTHFRKLTKAFYGFLILFCFSTAEIKAQPGSCLNFVAGNYNFLDFPVSSCWTLGNNFTLEMWIKPTGTNNQILLYAGYGCITCPAWVLGIGPEITCGYGGGAGKIVFSTINGPKVESDVSPTTGVWTHVAITYNGSEMLMFINGRVQTSIARYVGTFSTPSYMEMGMDPGCSGRLPFNGSMDELRIWNIARTDCQIQSYMNCEIPTIATNLIANFHFNAGTGGANNSAFTTLVDATGSASPGNLYNFTLNGGTSNWLTPGGVVNSFTTPLVPTVNVNIQGNGTSITDGDMTPAATDFTDFNGTLSRTFVIQNTVGGGTLTPGVYITGPDWNSFSVTTLPSPIVGIGTTNFVISATGVTGGIKNATVNVVNNDCSAAKTVYDFAITSSVVTASTLKYDGVDDGSYINQIIYNDFTIEYWMKTSMAPPGGAPWQWYGGYGIVDAEIPGITNDFGTSLCGPGVLGFGIGDPDVSIFSSTPVNTGNWVHVAVTRNDASGQMKLYINGVLEASGFGATGGRGTGYITMGRMLSGVNYFNGYLDDVRFWNIVRTECEIQTYMNCEIPTSATGLVGNYHFNQGIPGGNNTSITTIYDASGFGNDGVVEASMALTGTVSNWVNPGAIVTDYSVPGSTLAAVSIKGNATTIANNDFTPSTSDFTDFQSNPTRTFVIQNIGTGLLYLNALTFTGADSSEFSVLSLPANTLTTGATGTIVIAFTPTAGGVRSATVNIASTDCATPLYRFTIKGAAPLADALSFDGVDDVTGRAILTTNTTSVTLQAKVYWRGTTSQSQMLVYNGHSSISGYGIYNNSGSGALSVLYGGISFTPFNYTLTPNQWTSLSIVLRNGVVECYANGVLTSITNVASPSVPSASFSIGNNAVGGENFNGIIDEVRFWNRALTQCDIQTYMNCEIPGAATGLLGNYHFNQGSALLSNPTVTMLTDASGNSNDLTLSNFALTSTISNWVSPGAVVAGFTTTSPPTSSITLTGNGNPIANNSTTVTTLNFTDFGTATTRTFVIQNSNTGTLNIGAPYITGVNASEYSITVLPSSTLAALATTSFVVTFSPTAGGTRVATVNINNNDCNVPIFNFAINGTAPLASALDFDGIDDVVDCGTILTGSYTKEAWVKMVAGAVDYDFISGGNGITTGHALFAPNAYGNQLAAGHNGFWNAVIDPTPLSFNTWYHIAVTYDAPNTTMKLYKNGVLVSSNYSVSPYTNNHVYIGAISSFSQHKGTIDEARIWSTVRTQCEIQTYMNCEIPTSATGLIANYHFNQGSAGLNNTAITNLTDAAGSNNGTLIGFSETGLTSNWVVPGAMVNGYTTTAAPTASISITGNSNPISNNSTTVTTLNFTDFGPASTRTFVIQNSNTGTLNIGSPYLTGINASEFSITVLPSTSTLSASATTSFVVAFTPTAGGVRATTVNINNNDCNKPIFNFVINGAAPLASALNFDGVNDYVDIPLNGSIPVGFTPYTIEAKIKPNVHGMNGIIGWGNYGTLNQTNALRLGPSNTINNYWYGNDIQVTVPNLADGNWHHIASTFDGVARRLYLDGLLVGQDFPTIHTVANNANMRIGSTCTSCGGEYFDGGIDEIRVWNIARTECEIQSYKDCEIPTTAPGLVLNYHFNQGSAGLDNTSVATATDASASAITGTLTNMSLTGLSSNWISPGSVVNGYSTTLAPSASISVTGNSNPISNNSTTVTTLNFTDFGSALTRTFVIQNSNTGTLNIGAPYLTGVNASEFSITVLPSTSTLSASATISFVVAFTPTAGGIRAATLNINNNDCNKPIFNFVIKGAAPLASALNFDGVDDYVDLTSNSIPTGNSDFTYEFWVKIKSAQAGHRWITSLGSPTSGSLLTIGYDGSTGNKIRIHHFGPDLIATTAAIPSNVWTHVAINYRGSTFSNDIFINGIYIETLNFGAPLTIPANSILEVGSFAANSVYCPNMDLDELRIWNRALCVGEIQNNMNCEIATATVGLVGNYHFNQGSVGVDNTSVPTLTDASVSANTGTLTNFALTNTVSNWVNPGAVTSGSSCSVYLSPEINLMGNAISILDGDNTPSISDNTDFGALCSNANTVRTFSIQNLGTAPLSITSITMSGTNAALFTVSALSPASPIGVGSSAIFTVTFTPATAGVKIATLNINSNDCDEALYDVVLTGTANALPVVSASTSNSIICNTFTTSVNGSGANTYTWSGVIPATNGIAFSPSATANYTVTGTNTLTGCTSTNLAVQTITVNALPIVTVAAVSNSICVGGSVTLTVTGANTYTWSPGALNGATIITSPAITTTYSAIGTNTLTGCTSTNSALKTITVNAIPSVTAATPSSTLCFGVSATLTASGASTYTWNPGTLIGSTVNPVPASTITYSLSGTSAAGCISTNTATQLITVNPLPTVSINALIPVICSGGTASLAALGANSYTWNPGGSTTGTITPSLTSNTSYTLIGKSTAGCTSTNLATQIVTVNALPTVTASTSNSVICNSGTTSLIGSGANTYTWTNNIPNAAAFSPTITSSYTLSGTFTLTGCTNTNLAVQTISVNPTPTVGLSVTNTAICAGNSTSLTGNGANTYTWISSTGTVNGTAINPTLTSSTSYTLTGSSPAGCTNTNTVVQLITVNPLPVVTASASNPSVCAGFSTTLNGGGAVSYTWTGSVLNNTAFAPGASNSYTVTGTDINNCQNTASITVTVNPIPSVTANITSTTVCAGSSLTLSGSGANTYTWSGGITDGVAFSPSLTGSYNLTGISGAGCTNTNAAIVSVTVNALPSVTASASSSAICIGNTATLSGTGALTYTWTGGVTNNTSFTPTLSNTYTLTGEDTNGCQDTANVMLTVNNLPVLIISGTKTLSCEAETTTLTASGASTYTWNTAQTTSTLIITPTLTTTYSITGTDLNGCVNSTSYTQSVSPCNGSITAVVTVTNVSCAGKKDGKVSITSTNTYSNGVVSYIWSPNTLCAPNTCDYLEGLNAGTISLTIKVTYTLNNILVKQDSIVIDTIVILDENGPCELSIFNGFTPNGDGLNDTWQIDNITEFPKNKVTVFNRWGQKVYEAEGYDNAVKSWPTAEETTKLQPNTYFYIIDLGNGDKPIKGWVELIK